MDSIKEIIDELWHRSNLSFLWHSGQSIINQIYKKSPGQLFVGNISRQWGKSFWAVTIAISFCLANANAKVRFGAAFHDDLKEFIIPTFDLVLETCPPELRPKYKISGSKYIFANLSEIKLVGLDKNPNKLRGNKLDLIIIDEAGFVTKLEYIYKSIIIPATTHRRNCRVILISTPPVSPDHPFIEFVNRAELEGCYTHLTVYDNPLIDEYDIERFKKESGGEHTSTFKREYLAQVVIDEDRAIIPEWDDKYIQEVEQDEYYRFYHKYVMMDLGTKDFTAPLYGYWDFKKAQFIIEDEDCISGPKMNTAMLVNRIRNKEKELWGEQKPFRRICDNNWPLMVLDLSSMHDLPFIPTDKEKLESMINECRIMIQRGEIIINPRCKHLIGCLRYGIWNERRTEFSRSKVYGHYDHLAALIYGCRNLSKNTNPIPLDYGHESYRSWKLGLKNKQSHNATVLSEIFKVQGKEQKYGNKR